MTLRSVLNVIMRVAWRKPSCATQHGSIFLIVFGAAITLIPSIAYAHADLLFASPAPGEQLTETPAEIRLTFSEVMGEETAVLLLNESLQPVDGLVVEIEPQNPRQVLAELPPLEPGTYTVQWMAVSLDGHPISGSYTFQLLASASATTIPALVGAAVLLVLLVGWRWRRTWVNSEVG